MYTPSHYKNDDQSLSERIVRENQFATLIVSAPGEPSISHLPLLLDGSRLVGHMARANPQWRAFPSRVLAIFNGAHGYISPAWYEPADDNVPTWNYAAVHVRGQAKIIENEDAVFETMQKLVIDNETRYGTGWKLERNSALEKLSKAIVAFEIVDLTFEGKLKLSQKIEPAEHAAVIKGLRELGNTELAQWMQQTAKI